MPNLPWPAVLPSACKKCDDRILIGAVAYGRMMVAFGDDHQAAIAKGPRQGLRRAGQIVLGAACNEHRLRQQMQLLGGENVAGPADAGGPRGGGGAPPFSKKTKNPPLPHAAFSRGPGPKT